MTCWPLRLPVLKGFRIVPSKKPDSFLPSAMSYLRLSFLLLWLPLAGHAQRFGFIDSQEILNKLPEYKQAEQELAKAVQNWQREIEEKQKALDKLKSDYLAEEVMLTAEMKKERQTKIQKKEDELRDFQNRIFGFEGMYFLKRKELELPLQEKVAKAAAKVAKRKKLQFLFDKAGDLTVIYANPVHDYTDFVLEELGLGDPADNPNNAKPGADKPKGSSGEGAPASPGGF